MTESHSAPAQEPGRRYNPRQTAQRLFTDVHQPVSAVSRHSAARRHSLPAPASQTPRSPAHVTGAPQQASPSSQPMQVMAPDIAAKYQKVQQASQAPKLPATQRAVAVTTPAAPRLRRSLVLHRRIVDKAASHQKQAKQQRIKTVYAFGLGGLAALVFMSGVLVMTGRFSNHQGSTNTVVNQSTAAAKTLGVRTDQSSPISVNEEEVPAAAVDEYDVSANEPRVIIIPRLHVQSRVMQVNQTYNSEPAQTDSLFDFGWLNSSALPGINGVTVLGGYATGPTKIGPLAAISELKVGDDITIERGDGKSYVYKVIHSQTYEANKVDMTTVRSPAIAGKPGLNILTYTGRFNVRTNQYEQRTVIFAAMQ